MANLKSHVYYIVTHKYLFTLFLSLLALALCVTASLCGTQTPMRVLFVNGYVCNVYSYKMRTENWMQFRYAEQKDSGKHVSCCQCCCCCNNFTSFWMIPFDTWGWLNCTKVIKLTEKKTQTDRQRWRWKQWERKRTTKESIKKLHIKTRWVEIKWCIRKNWLNLSHGLLQSSTFCFTAVYISFSLRLFHRNMKRISYPLHLIEYKTFHVI